MNTTQVEVTGDPVSLYWINEDYIVVVFRTFLLVMHSLTKEFEKPMIEKIRFFQSTSTRGGISC